MKRSKLVSAASAGLLVVGLGVAAFLAARWLTAPVGEEEDLGEDPAEAPLPDAGDDLPPGHRLERVRAHERDRFETFPGRVAAEGWIPVRAPVGMRAAIVRIHKEVGEAVKKGDVLIELNDAEYARAADEAEKAGDAEKAKRYREFVAQAKVRAPVDGLVVALPHDVGEIPNDVGRPLVALNDPSRYSFRFELPGSAVGAVAHLGARVGVDLEGGLRAEGTVTGYEDAPEGLSRVVVGLDAVAGLEPDMPGLVRLPTSKEEVALVPKAAVTRRQGVYVVRVFETDTRTLAERTLLTDGDVGDDWIVTAGVFPGEAVAVPSR